MGKAVFLDRDGVINHNRQDYVKCWEEFVFLPGALEALRRLAETPLLIIIVTNQSAINRGLMPRHVAQDINRRMTEEIRNSGGRIDAILMCPHRPDELCNCRKPQPGMLLEAADRFQLDLRQCYLVGDASSDIEAGLKVGCKVVMVRTGLGQKHIAGHVNDARSFPVVHDLGEAVEWIIEQEM
jgi:D-glycero-D-manno-heptose 1,7-bisphosphate phosphatase